MLGFDAGSVFVRLGANFSDDGFDKYDRAVEQARKRKAVETKLGGDFNPKAFDAYERALKETAQRAKRKDAFKAELGGDFDNRAFHQYEKATKDVQKHDRDLVRSQGRVRTAFGNVYGRSGALFAAAGGLYGLQAAGKAVIGTASDINESLTKNQVLFGKYADDVEKFSDKSAVSFGISKKAALEYTGVFGNLFTSLGISSKESAKFSVNLSKLGADMASFNNTSIDEALEAIRSGLVGETEPLRKFGVNMNDATLKIEAHKLAKKGLISESKANAQTLDPETKALAAQSLIIKQTASAHGDFKRTSGGLANQQRILKATITDVGGEIGKGLLPKVQAGVTWLNKFIKEMRSGTGDGGKFVDKLKDIWHEIEPIVKWLGRATANVAKFADKHRDITKVAAAIVGVGLAVNAIKTSKAVSGIGTLLGVLKKLAKTKAGETAASEIADGLGGVPGKGDKKMGRIRTWMRRVFGRAGTSAGGAAAANSAEQLALDFGPAANAKQGKFRSAMRRVFGRAGESGGVAAADGIVGSKGLTSEGSFNKTRSAGGRLGKVMGRAFGIAAFIAFVIAFEPELEKFWQKVKGKFGLPNELKSFGEGIGRRITAPFHGGDGGMDHPRGHAAGGTVTTPWQIVGEEGPELARLPTGTRVHTASQTKKMLGGALNMKGQLEQEAREAQKGSKLVAAALNLVPTEAKKHGKKTGKNLTDEIKSGTTDATARVKKFRGDVGDHLDDLAADGKKKVRKFSRSVTDGISDAKDAGEKHLRRLERVAGQRLGAVASIGKSRSGQFSRSVARSMGTTDNAVFTGLSYVSSATSEALKAFDAKPVSLTVPRPKGIPGHATGGIPNPGSGARDDHMLVSPDGRAVAALSGTEGIINTPQMGVIDHALAVAKAVGASAFGGLGELWGSGMRHFAGGGILGRANALERMHLPYVWGGHHGDRGPIRNPQPGLDCSSAVSYVLGIPPRVSSGFMNYGKPGRGKVSILSNPSHAYMVINGRAFGTSGENPGGGAGWIDSYTYRSGFSVRHVDGELGSTDIPKVTVRGTAGGMKSLAQAAINRVRKGATGAVDKAASALDDPFGQPLQEGAGNYLSTAYGPPWGGIQGTGVTATGIDLRRGPQRHIVAVDPSRIKLGSRVRVSPNPFGYDGAFLAGDTGGAIKGNRLDFYDWRGRRAQNAWGKRLVNVTAATRGGQLRRFAGGGPLNRIVDRATKRVKGLKNRIKGFPDQIDILEGRYHRLENDYARPGQDDEDYVIPATATSPARIDDRAIARRTGQLDQLVSLRRKITMLYQREAKAMKQMIETYKASIRRVRAAMRGAKSKDRPNYLKTLRGFEGKVRGLRTDRNEVLSTASDQYLDLRELRAERKGLRGSAESALAELVGETTPPDPGGDTSNPDLDAQLAQANERIRVLQETVRVSQANLGALSGPGDIGTSGSSSALQASYADALLPVGVGQVGMQSPVTGSQTPLAGVEPGFYLLRITDPEGQQQLAQASNAGNSLSGYVPAPRETTGV